MSQIANISVYDGAATPVLHTLVPISVTRTGNSVKAEWREVSASVPTDAQVSATAILTKLKSGVYKCEARVAVPVMESVTNQNSSGYTAAPKVAYVNTYLCTGFFHGRSDVTGRRLARQILTNLLGNVSTSVAAATSGPLPDLFDYLVAPT